MDIEIADLSHRLPEQTLLDLLLLSAFPRPRAEQLRIAQAFHDSPDHQFWVAQREEVPIGGCGVIDSGADPAIIRYLGVIEAYRGNGVGRSLVETAIAHLRGHRIEAETDDDAKDFYRKCGFAVRSIGEKYPGTVRYVCTYTKPRD